MRYNRRRKRFVRKVIVTALLLLMTGSAWVLLFSASGSLRRGSGAFLAAFSVVLSSVLAAMAYKPLEKAVTAGLARWMFRKRPDPYGTLERLIDEALDTLSLSALAHLIVNTVAETFQLKRAALMLAFPDPGRFRVWAGNGALPQQVRVLEFTAESPLVDVLHHERRLVGRTDLLRRVSWEEATALGHDFETLLVSWVLPFFDGDALMGFLCMGECPQGSAFTPADVQFLDHFASRLRPALRSAMAHERLSRRVAELAGEQAGALQRAKLAAIGELASGLAHEIHNPLAIISGKAQMLLLKKEEGLYDARVASALEAIVRQAQRAAAITRKLVVFTQDGRSEPELLDLRRVAQEALDVLAYQTSLEGLTLRKRFSQDLRPVLAPAGQMRELVMSLLMHAIRALDGKGVIELDIFSRAAKDRVEIHVRHDGVLGDAGGAAKLFDPFSDGREGQSGLELFVVQQVAHRWGGSARAESAPRRGTLLIVELPAARGTLPSFPAAAHLRGRDTVQAASG